MLAVTRSDLADPGPATAQALSQLAGSSLGAVPAVAVSGTTGQGLEQLRAALDVLVASLPAPDPAAPVRLWVDRAFTVRGAGTVVTGTLTAGVLRTGDTLQLRGRQVRVRGLQSLGRIEDEVASVARVAVNLRGIERDDLSRGDALLTPGAWRATTGLDVRLSRQPARLPEHLVLHVGSTAVPVRVRVLGDDVVRLLLDRPLPLRAGDRALLRDPAEQRVAAGVTVLDADPPALRRRGAAAGRAAELRTATGDPDLAEEVGRRGAVAKVDLAALGVTLGAVEGVREVGGWLVSEKAWQVWCVAVRRAVDEHAAGHPLEAGLPAAAAVQATGLPAADLLGPLLLGAGLKQVAGRVRRPGAVPQLGAAEPGLRAVEQRLRADPFAAPESPDLALLGLGTRELAAAETAGRLVRVGSDVVLLPDGPARAMRVLSGLTQPFTLSQARQALGTTRRVAVPLLEHLDTRGWTRRVDGNLREVVR